MHQPPAASQPAPFSTPDPSRFRVPKPKRSGRDLTDAGPAKDGRTTTPASAAAARPTPRFAPSWKRQPTQSQADIRTPAQSAVRKFSVAGGMNSGSRSSTAASRRFLSHASGLSSQHRRRHSLGRDPFHGGGEDAIEDGSSPPQAPLQTQQTLEEEEGGILMVVRESPTATRTKQPTAASQPPPRPGIFSTSARRRKQRLGLEDDIEDVLSSGSWPGSDDEDDIVRESGKTVDDHVGEGDNEVPMPDSGPNSIVNTTATAIATPVPQSQLPLARQQMSAARLLSSIQPLKRRRLFVSRGLITSSPSAAGSDQEGGGEADEDQDAHGENHGRPPAFVPRFRQRRIRHAWDGDDIVDDDGSGDGGRNEDIRDIVNYGELLEYSQSSDEDGNTQNKEDDDDEIMDHYHDEEDDEDTILDQTPPRIRRARQRQKDNEEQQRQEQRQRMPTFQRARLFMTARWPIYDEDMGGDHEHTAHNVEDTLSQDLTTTPARQRHYYDALLHQPPPDFFSPQKKRRQKRPRKSRHSNENDLDGLGGLTSPSPAAVAATAAAIYAFEHCASLQALYNVMLQQKIDGPSVSPDMPGRIDSLDVVVRPAKRTGRGLKQVVDSPVKLLATELGLPVHERDTFTGWTPPASTNLLIAVSFGLFVPPRLLRAAKFGGLNVHPSLLPDLHGAAPIEHAVLLGRDRTGVTVQTLHETTFDGGRRLLQGPVDLTQQSEPAEAKAEAKASPIEATSFPSGRTLGIPLDDRVTSDDLHELLAPIGAHLLSEVLRRGLYLPERESQKPEVTYTPPFPPAAAPKLSKGDRQVLWQAEDMKKTTSANIDRQARALGELWTYLQIPPSAKAPQGQTKRVIFDNIDLVACPKWLRVALDGGPTANEWPSGVRTLTFVQDVAGQDGEQKTLTLPFVVDGKSIVFPVGVDANGLDNELSCLRIGSIKVEGHGVHTAKEAVGNFGAKDVSAKDISWDVVLR
ncbi:Methionyl-tRNA formyltransferase [Sporothrix stenoceras]|uniref:Methionyl-tRNA formyltransferase n=1 Tax=Sporothrix stenoceras TaxID=5173 RepID=A0ABR3YQQ4_9PEZI